MASTSTSSVQRSFVYDVFLSFRGEDVRTSFVDHLYKALNDKGIIIYKDDKSIVQGQEISDQLITAIKSSKFHVIVFSKNYANSAWCLEELAQIMECQETGEQTAYPIFYDVQPTEVRSQSGPVGVAFEKHLKKEAIVGWRIALKIVACQDCLGLNTSDGQAGNEATRRWKHALTRASNLAGRELQNTGDGHEVQFINKVVEDILQNPHFTNFSIDANLVGMAIRIQKLLSSLQVDSDEVRMIGIKGIGGGGKTTLARAVFDHISSRFEGKSFVENVRERSKGGSSLHNLQKQVLSSVFSDQNIFISGASDGKNLIKRMMPGRTALIVLDDVDHIEQLEALVGDSSRFKPRSRIIITTRDEQVLIGYGIQRDNIYDVNMLSDEESINLLSRHAFKRESPIQGFEDLSKRVVSYAAGLPLTIKLLGSFLCGRPQDEWEDTIKRLKTIPWHDTLRRLEISYDGLEEDHKQIFLHVACLLKGNLEREAIIMLERCGFHARIGLRVLEQKSLITIRHYEVHGYDIKVVAMHDHIEEMGRNIVSRLHPADPNKHIILWKKDEIEHILGNELGTEVIRSIKLENADLHATKILQGLQKMTNLRFLSITERYAEYKIDEAGGYLPNSLRYLDWGSYRFRYLPKIYQADNLVHLCMKESNIYQLWEGEEKKVLPKLKFLDLSRSNLKTFDLEMTPNLEEVVLEKCHELVEVKMGIECPHLKEVNLQGCWALGKLKMSNKCPNILRLNLSNCSNFKELQMHVEFPKLESLNFGYSGLTNLNLGLTPNLKYLDLHECRDLVELHVPVECPKLISLYLGGFKVSDFKPDLAPFLEKLESLKWLFLESIDIECLPYSICTLRHLTYLGIKSCSHLKQLPQDIGRLGCLEQLNLLDCKSLQDIPNSIFKMECLKELNLSGCKGLKKLGDEFERLECLHTLRLEGCSSLQDIPDSICKMKCLESLDLRDCKGLKKLPDEFGRLESLKVLYVICGGIENLSQSISQLKGLEVIDDVYISNTKS